MVDGDWSVDRATGNIRYIGDGHLGASPSYATVIQFHRWLQDKADDASAVGNDELDITDINPSARSTDNYITLLGSYNIDDASAQHLYDGSIVQGTGGTEVIYDGIVNFGNAGVAIMIHQDGAVLGNGTAWWNSLGGLNADANQGISHRFMIKVRDAGSDIDGRRLIGLCRTLDDSNQNTYGEFTINGSSRGNNVLALSDSADLNNTNTATTISGWDRFANLTPGYDEQDIDLNGTQEQYYSEWSFSEAGSTPASTTINDLYEYTKWLTRDGSAETLYGLSGELFRGITHEITHGAVTGGNTEFEEGSSITFSNGAVGQVLAFDTTSGTKTWIQLLSGVAPAASDTMTQSADSATVSAVTARALNYPFIGTSTGSAIIGAYGVGFKSTDLQASDQITQLTGAQVPVPNNVTFSVTGLVAGEDRVLVGPWDGVATDASGNAEIDYNQFTVKDTLSTDNVASITVTGDSLPTDTPASGTIRVQDDAGYYRRLKYSSYDSATGVFTIDSTYHGSLDTDNPTNQTEDDFSGTNASSGNNLFISYIDDIASGTSLSVGVVYLADRDLVVKVRDGGASPIKEFIQTGQIKTTNQSVAAIRTTDA